MSFSKSFTGKKAAVLAAMVAFAAEQKTTDEGYNASQGTIDGHQKQIAAGTECVKSALEGAHDEADVNAYLNGHAGADGKGNWGFTVGCSGNPTPES